MTIAIKYPLFAVQADSAHRPSNTRRDIVDTTRVIKVIFAVL